MPCTGSTSMLRMLRAASAKFASTAAPSMMSALLSPSLVKFFCSALVLPSCTVALSSTMMPPSLALADKACLRASARTFFGRSIAWLRGVGPNERPPPRNRLTRAGPWRADPVPFCRYIFLPVRLISARFLTSWVPRWRLASCQRTQRCRMSARGSRPKMASESSTEPASVPSSDMIFSSMSRALLIGRRGFRRRRLGVARGRLRIGQAELARLRCLLRQLLLDCVPQRDPTALGTRHRTLAQDEAALDIGPHHLEIQRGDAIDAHMARHLLVLEGLARILPPAGRADRAMRDRDTMRGAQPAEIPAFHAAGEALADRSPGHIDKLADDEVVGCDLCTDRDQVALRHAKLGELALGLDLGNREMTAIGLGQVLRLASAGAELQRDVAVLVHGAVGHDLTFGKAQHRHRYVLASVGKDAGDADRLCDHPGTHVDCPVSYQLGAWPLRRRRRLDRAASALPPTAAS